MRFVKAKYEIWEPKECNAKNILESIERAAKVCYKSEGNIKDGSALPFVKGLIKRGHTSCLEHGSIYFKVNIPLLTSYYDKMKVNKKEDLYSWFLFRCWDVIDDSGTGFGDYRLSGYSNKKTKNNYEYDSDLFIYTNARFVYEKCPRLFWDIILERELPDFIELFTPAENDKYRRQTIFFTADQRITEEFIRHRIASPNKESTRYCCYSSDKHNNELTFIIPPKLENYIWDGDKPECVFYADSLKWKVHDKVIKSKDIELLLNVYENTENVYKSLTTLYNWRAEEARIALTLGTKADLVLTNSLIDWCYGRPEPIDKYIANIDNGEIQGKRIKGFFGLRTDGAAHPQARELAIPLMNEFEKKGWLIKEE